MDKGSQPAGSLGERNVYANLHFSPIGLRRSEVTQVGSNIDDVRLVQLGIMPANVTELRCIIVDCFVEV